MIKCSNCDSPNNPDSRFCIKCGQILNQRPGEVLPYTNLHRRHLGEATARVLISLLLLWFLRTILVNLSFVEGLTIPDIPFSASEIIVFIVYLITFFLVFGYTQTLSVHWATVFPRLALLTQPLIIIVYVILLSLAYRTLLPVIVTLTDDPADFLLVFRVILTILAIILLSWAGKFIYDALPGWLSNIRLETAYGQVPCQNCARLNPAFMNYCGYCGHSLKLELETAEDQ